MKDFGLFNRIYTEYLVFCTPDIAYKMAVRKIKMMQAEKEAK